jgi:hypothetical protein
MARDGGARVRGLSPPDDIRHRDMKWDPDHEMWVSRDFTPVNRSLSGSDDRTAYLGESGVKSRLGRAWRLRELENDRYDAVRKELGHSGPYMPVILEACAEGELAMEYRHGVASYGAFTYCAAKILRGSRKRGVNLTYEQLVQKTRDELKELHYKQSPQVVGPAVSRAAQLPWIPPGTEAPKRGRSRRK